MDNISRLRHGTLAWALLLTLASATPAQQWAKDMFNHTSHDFGAVARAAKVEHRFRIENIFVENVHIASARSSCGCTKAEVTKQLLKTWETAEVVATIDTRDFLGRRDATITVTFDQPFPAEVQLQVHCNIRGDVVVQPGSVYFGSVAQGIASQQHVAVSYAGRDSWRILRVESPNPNLSAVAVEKSPGGGRVDYDLAVTLKGSTMPGYIHDDLILVTDDSNPQIARVPVGVEAIVQPSISVYPSPLVMGSVVQGKAVTRILVVKGTAPFHIVQVKSSDKRFQAAPPEGAGNLYRLPLTFTAAASEAAGRPTAKISIETDAAAGRHVEVAASAEVLPKAETGLKKAEDQPAAPPLLTPMPQ